MSSKRYPSLTPLSASMLLHFHCSTEPYPIQRAPAQLEVIETFLAADIIYRKEGDIYHTTDKGDAWVKAILNTPIPRIAYVDAQGKEIE